jgi:hypothetical protein
MLALYSLSSALVLPGSTLQGAAIAPHSRFMREHICMQDPTQNQRLREETEAPFAKLRLFAWPVLFAGAGLGTFIASTTLIAEAIGSREAIDGSALNLGIDIAAVISVGALWRNDVASRDTRLRRITAGSAIAALSVLCLADGTSRPLKNLRVGRGEGGDGMRVVIVAATEKALCSTLRQAEELSPRLVESDLLLVPVLLDSSGATPRAEAPTAAMLTRDSDAAAPREHLALPQALANWQDVLAIELQTALGQDATAADRGLTLVLKKNGRVGTRRLGSPDWDAMLLDVAARKQAGLDTVNI